jgi:hypothetical protein
LLQVMGCFADEEHQYAIEPVRSGNCHKGMPFTVVATYSGGKPSSRQLL